MSTGQELFEDAYADLGVGNPGDNLAPDILTRGTRIASRMLSSWSAEMKVIVSTLDELTWTAGSQSMTIGVGGDLNTARPIEITGFQSRKSTLDYTLTQVSFEQYQSTILKSTATDYPDVFAYQKTNPLGIIYIYPVAISNLPVRLQSKKALSDVALIDVLAWPPGWELAVQTNLTVLLAPSVGKEAKRSTVVEAERALTIIKEANEDDEEMWPDYMMPGFGAGENIDILTNK
jgi:hypothetical protein